MNDPGELPTTAREFLARVRPLDDVEVARLSQTRERILRATAAGGIAAVVTTSARPWFATTLGKIGVCGALIGVGAIAIQLQRARRAPNVVAMAPAGSQHVAIVATASVAPAPSATAEIEAPAPAPTPTAAQRPQQFVAPKPSVTSTPAAASIEPAPSVDLAGEASLLRAAQTELAKGNAAHALELFDRHAALYPNGQLAPERVVGRALASCALGRPNAKAEARALLATGVSPGLAARLRERCAIDE